MRLRIDDYEAEALDQLPQMVADYYAGGSRDEGTLRANRSGWDRWRLRHRVLVDVSELDASIEVPGGRAAFPVVAAPTAFHGLAHPDAEKATAAGVSVAGTAMCLSTLSNTPVEEVVASADGAPVIFQLYVYKDRGATDAIVARVREAGCKALMVTVDAAILGTRERDIRNGFHLPPPWSLPNAAPTGVAVPASAGASGLAAYVAEQLDQSLSWKDLEAFVARAGMPVWVKGIVRDDDAARAADLGVAGIVVSNHGGRQLDGGVSTAEALPEVVEAVGGQCPVWVDGGIRRGTDVVKALALGARAVMVGRPVLWGLTVGGADGVRDVLGQLRAEVEEAMALAGAPNVADVTRDLVR